MKYQVLFATSLLAAAQAQAFVIDTSGSAEAMFVGFGSPFVSTVGYAYDYDG